MIKNDIEQINNIGRRIKEETSRMLWAVSAGVCEFRGCTNRLYKHHITGENINLSEKAHIYAFSRGGKRYLDIFKKKIHDIDNLMMVCKPCHDLMDSDDTEYSAEMLIEMKKEHEERIQILTSIKPELKSEVIIYNCNIDTRPIKINEFDANMAITPDHYPSRINPIILSPELCLYDDEENFWNVMAIDLERKINQYESNIRDKHISLFAIAPQPLLFKLGTILNRNYNIDTRQSQDNISDWKWKSAEKGIVVNIVDNEYKSKDVVLIIEITCGISDDKILDMFGEIRIIRIKSSIYDPKCIKSKMDLNEIIIKYRDVLNNIRINHPNDTIIHLFTIAPASVSIEMGRNLMKGDPSIITYNRNKLTEKFVKAIDFTIKENN